jgi:hypothetical protein
MSDFYPSSYDEVEYVKAHGQKLASHSLGHFPDFASTTLFPLGSMGNTPDNYMPLYLNDTTSGGSVYGEVEVSKYLIESDHNVQVKSFRAGHLAYNRRLPKALYDLGYLYNSSFSANDVLTNFPFYDIDNLTFSGDQLPVLEIPMTISDAAACCPFTQENALERAALWADITIKNNNNGAPTVLLIHPNRNYKLTAEQFYVNALPSDVRYMFLDDFGDYWKKRETANVVTEYNNDSLIVHFNGFQMYSNLSLVVNDASQLTSIRFFDANNMELFPQSLNVDFNETRYCHFVYSDNVEVCNGQDDDGDGLTDENLSYTQYQDLDQDGYGNQAITLLACTAQSGFVTNALDCDDSSTVIHPDNAEYCDSLDNNCNGLTDEGLDWNTYYWDADQDGFGNDNVAVTTCLSPTQYILQNGDCDDENGLINPAQSEVCNDADDNCDGGIDEGLAFVMYYEDLDQDGFGNDSVSVMRCVLPFGFVFQHGDCNDNHANVNPQSVEQCGDNLDNDCDGEVDEGCVIDMDEDGYDVLQDCDDENPWAYPGANEICGNGIDEDCDGVDLICPFYGCTDVTAYNYNPAANTDDGSCIAVVNGCTDATAFNYNPAANTDDGSCIAVVNGCTDATAFNYNPAANTDDGSCIAVVSGCTDATAFNFNSAANTDDGSCIAVVNGCTDATAFNYNPAANTDDGSCIAVVNGCTDATAFNYNPSANTDNGSCIAVVNGCTDVTAFNYNPAANTDDGSCIAVVNGCTDATAFNYNPAANTDDGSCIAVVNGCTDATACNYNLQANVDDGSCVLPQQELCNQFDDDCDGIVDNGLAFFTYFTDSDTDGQGAGAGFTTCMEQGTGYSLIGGDWDNDCDGLVNEGWQGADVPAVNVNTAVYPTCTTGNLFSANFNNGTNSVVIDGNGPDLWYKLQAQYNTLRVGLSAASGINSLSIYKEVSGCLQLIETESEITTGNQTLLTDDLVPGNTYYIVAHQINSPTNISAKICFNHLVSTTCDHVYSNNTGVYSSVCTSFKAVYKTFATQYVFNVLGAVQNGQNISISPWSYTTPTSSSIVTRLGSILPANQGTSNVTYTLSIPVVYGLLDAAGNTVLLTANGTNTCNVTLTPEAAVVLRSADRCPAIKSTTQPIVTDRSVCGALRYEWEFTQVSPISQAPITVLGGMNTNALFLNTVPGISNGKTYNVRVRPIHSSGSVGNYGASYCLKTTGAGMALEGSDEGPMESFATALTDFVLYPNPSNQDDITIFWTAFQDDVKHIVLRDMQGRVIRNEKINVSGNSVEFNLNSIEAGVYILEINGVGVRVIRTR